MDTESILKSIGYLGIFLSVFIEAGVIFGLLLPLPGFSLLFAAGVFTARGDLNLPIVIAVGITAAILGYLFGYGTGRLYGHKVFRSGNRKYFTPEQGLQLKNFMHKYGYSALILGRYVPFVHTIIPVASGYARTSFVPFLFANVAGAVLWALSAVFMGFFLGRAIPHAELYLIPLVVGVFVICNIRPVRRRLKKLASRMGRM